MFPLVGDRISAGDRYLKDYTASYNTAGARRLRPDSDGLNHAHRYIIASYTAGKTAYLNTIISRIGVVYVCKAQRGSRGAVYQVAVTSPLIR